MDVGELDQRADIGNCVVRGGKDVVLNLKEDENWKICGRGVWELELGRERERERENG